MSEWVVAGQWAANSARGNWYGVTYRQVMQAAVLAVSGSKVRITLRASSAGVLDIPDCFIGLCAGTDPAGAEFMATPTRVTFGGDDDVSIPAGGSVVSDEIDFVFDRTDGNALVVSFAVSSQRFHANTRGRATADDVTLHYINGNHANDMPGDLGGNIFRYDPDFEVLSVTKIEIFADDVEGVVVDLDSSYEIGSGDPGAEVSKYSPYALLGIANVTEASKFNPYALLGTANVTEASKLSAYIILDSAVQISQVFSYRIGDPSGDITVTRVFDYAIEGEGFEVEQEFDYSIFGPFDTSLVSSYKIFGPFEVEQEFDYRVTSFAFETDLEFDYRIIGQFSTEIGFSYAIEESTEITATLPSTYVIDDQPLVNVPSIELYPMEPVREGWAWLTQVNIAHSGKEQRIALRQRPRIMISYSVALPLEENRIRAYNQLYNSVGKTPKIPFFQYATHLEEPLLSGDTELVFDRSKTYIQSGTPICLFRNRTQQYLFVQALSLTATGAIIDASFPFNLSTDWEVMPVYFMRLPNLNSLSMEALTGEYSLSGEQAFRREFLRQGSVVVVPMFDGKSILTERPIAASSIEERFDSNAEVIDNGTGMPKPYSSYTNPFVDGSLTWLIDREVDMDFWRTFLDGVRGQQKTFFIPTWREDLTLISASLSSVIVEEVDFEEKFEHATYKCLQFETAAGIVQREVSSVEVLTSTSLRINLATNLPSTEVETISFLNLVRLNEDAVYFDHFRNYTTMSLSIRTVNE